MSNHDTSQRFMAIVGLLAFAILFALASAADAKSGKLKVGKSPSHPEALIMAWSGEVRPGMAEAIDIAFEKHKDEFKVIQFTISSGGGSVAEGERVIHVLDRRQEDAPPLHVRARRQAVRLDVRLHLRAGAEALCGALEHVAVPRGVANRQAHAQNLRA